ncbi:2-C-methyl-D-erythritol 4-phosphate cytidylyltransferase [Paenibacillus popilliae]|uniref:2-C-methyl-D-erythritol 4-phosphate cytidylyltransferase n=1 Tax=Paenibacillus popilliae ATCC 14706 TaxID=1212764 RepID=M9LY87_PAEPP|nr:2-C-methyl-D-erythritol 4-phosphate cytidylyltransferase [Paenibacillus popilliae]GAC41049.1 4-diphosphocytidyl-2-methyl-D-erithritol synthase [Paenibacillus popilliae ATCC 14706]
MEQGFGVVIVAAGRGSRMGAAESKQYLPLEGKPVIIHTLERFQTVQACDAIVWVASPEDTARCAAWQEEYGLDKIRVIVPGGTERQHSVYTGLQAVRELGLDYVLIHDGVRPFVETGSIEVCFRAAREHGAAVLAVPVKDTIKQVNGGVITATPDRRSLWAIQTPQAFRLVDVMAAHEQAAADGFIGTDDAMLMERAGMQVRIVEGEYTNVKLTTPDDLEWASWWLARREATPRGKR